MNAFYTQHLMLLTVIFMLDFIDFEICPRWWPWCEVNDEMGLSLLSPRNCWLYKLPDRLTFHFLLVHHDTTMKSPRSPWYQRDHHDVAIANRWINNVSDATKRGKTKKQEENQFNSDIPSIIGPMYIFHWNFYFRKCMIKRLSLKME